MKTTSFILGDKDFTVGPLTMGQLREIGVGSVEMGGPGVKDDALEQEKAWYNGCFRILSASLGLKVEEIEAMQGVTRPQLYQAIHAIYTLSGLIGDKKESGDANPGEGQGAATG